MPCPVTIKGAEWRSSGNLQKSGSLNWWRYMKDSEAQTIYIAYAPDRGRDSFFQGQPLSVWTRNCDCPLSFWKEIWKRYTLRTFVTIPPALLKVLQLRRR